MEYQSEIKNCQNCKKDFTIEPEDFLFYEKIKVPPPTFCPQCRFVRRLMWKNERSLNKRKCSMCDKNMISAYVDKTLFPVYCLECFKSDKWGAETYAEDYDFSKSFFVQWYKLFNRVPKQSLFHFGDCVNSEYDNFVYNVKDTYLSSSVTTGSEDVYFSNNCDNSKKIVDSYNVINSGLIYQSIGVSKNYNCQYSYWSSGCIDCNFIFYCLNCSDCFGCVNLNNKKYCIWNEQYTKEEYDEKTKEFNMGSYIFVKNEFKKFWDFSLKYPRKYSNIINSINSSGDELRECNNVKKSFNIYNSENVKYGYRSLNVKDSMDICHSYAWQAYEHAFAGAENSVDIKFVITGLPALNQVEYVDDCKSSSNLFGCIGLKNKQYYILNKQYAKEEYFEMVEKIKKHMDEIPYIDAKGRVYKYGEFFPYELCPFGYNETVINDHFPLTRQEIIDRGYPYKEKVENKYTITLKAKDIKDDIKDIDDSILNEVIECEGSGKAFKIIPFELQFYRRMNIPIPRLHPDERYKKRLELRNPMILYHRLCMHKGCTNEFETTYAPNKPEIVYCKECYQREVY